NGPNVSSWSSLASAGPSPRREHTGGKGERKANRGPPPVTPPRARHCGVDRGVPGAILCRSGFDRRRAVCNSPSSVEGGDWQGTSPMIPNSPVDWYLEGPSLVLRVLSYILIARLCLDLTFGTLGNNVVFRALTWLTDPVVRAVGVITPR